MESAMLLAPKSFHVRIGQLILLRLRGYGANK
jgi:hypothetical protein